MSSPDTFATAPAGGQQKQKITSIFDFSDDALNELRLWLEMNPPAVPITAILGFAQFTPTMNVVTAIESSTSSTYGNLATVGPQLTGLPNGKYVAFWGAQQSGNPGASVAEMAVSANGVAAPGGDHAMFTGSSAANLIPVVVADTFTLSGGANTLVAKYASSNNVSTCTWQNRWLLAIRYSNL